MRDIHETKVIIAQVFDDFLVLVCPTVWFLVPAWYHLLAARGIHWQISAIIRSALYLVQCLLALGYTEQIQKDNLARWWQ